MFTQAQLEELLSILTAPVTAFDCGTLCAPDNDGVPICCDSNRIVPVLYNNEYRLLRKRSDLWHRFVPRTKQQATVGDDMRTCERLAECKGAAFCERDNRSLACRTFPLEPYLDHDAELAGLVFNYDFDGTCPLVGSRHEILPEYIDQCLNMWQRAFGFAEAEREFYESHSETLRRSFGQKRQRIPVFTREGIRRMATRRPRARRR
jgi:hypothetical protein